MNSSWISGVTGSRIVYLPVAMIALSISLMALASDS